MQVFNQVSDSAQMHKVAGLKGITILEAKAAASGQLDIVLAKTERNEYVTWVYVFGQFASGHYFGNDIAQAGADYAERVS